MTVQKNKDLLRDLGRAYADIAAHPAQNAKRDMWRSLTDLTPVRPMVAIDQLPWHELDVDGELVLQVDDPFLRDIERSLRRSLYLWRHMPADMVLEPYLGLPKTILGTGFGIVTDQSTSSVDEASDVVGHAYHKQLQSMEDVQKIRNPEIRQDTETDRIRFEKASEALGDALPVRMVGATAGFPLWDRLSEWLSPEGVLFDLADRPEFMHALMRRFTEANLSYVDQMDALGLFEPAQPNVHCSYCYTKDLPAPGFDPAKPRAKDSWAYGMAQIFTSVSPDMTQEFEVEYVKRIFERFGNVYYGCCEALHDRIDIIRKLPNVRKISCSYWCDVETASERIGRDFVVSRKPTPMWLASENPDWSSMEKEIRFDLEACRRTGSPLEFILKDVSTVKYRPQNLWEWEKRVMGIVQEG
jgi:hypothetical protein